MTDTIPTVVPMYKRVPREFKTTPWFDEKEKPAYVGSYQVKTEDGIRYRYWTGKFWTEVGEDCDDAKWKWIWNPKKSKALFPWRGITEESR